MAIDNIRLPPDGAGKRVHVQQTVELAYDGGTLSGFAVGDHVFGKTTGASGIVSRISSGATSASGTIHILKDFDSVDFQNDEELTTIAQGNPAIALVNGTGTAGFVQQVIQVGDNNHSYGQAIDIFGAASVRFAEGSPKFDAFGNQKITQAHILNTFTHEHSDLIGTTSKHFTQQITGAASGTLDTNLVGYRMSTTNASGDKIVRTSNRYHIYTPGQSQLIEQTVFCGDSGKTGNVRRWGYFDDNDGYYFCLTGSAFGLVRRTSTSGFPVDTFVSQSSFNSDTGDGTAGSENPSGVAIDFTKLNLFWMDMVIGTGAVRMGLYSGPGQRTVLHTFENPNLFSAPHTKTATLPFRYENENVTGTSGGSELSMICGTVKSEGPDRPEEHFPFVPDSVEVNAITASVGTETIICGITAAHKYKNKINRFPLLPEKATIFATQPIRLRVYQSFVPVSASFQQVNSETLLDLDTSATDIGIMNVTKFLKLSEFVDGGKATTISVDDLFSPYSIFLTRTATAGTGSMIYLTAEPLATATTSSIIDFTITWNNGFYN